MLVVVGCWLLLVVIVVILVIAIVVIMVIVVVIVIVVFVIVCLCGASPLSGSSRLCQIQTLFSACVAACGALLVAWGPSRLGGVQCNEARHAMPEPAAGRAALLALAWPSLHSDLSRKRHLYQRGRF